VADAPTAASPSPRLTIPLSVGGILLALIGLGVSIYITIDDLAKIPLACPDRGFINCQKVTHSSYAHQHGVPLTALGIGFFLTMLVFQSPWAWRSMSRLVRLARLALATGGACMVLWLIWVELFRLDNLCLYCTSVHVVSILLFILTGIGTAATSPYAEVEPDEAESDGSDESGSDFDEAVLTP